MDYKATYTALHLSEPKLFRKPRCKRSDGKSQNRVSKSNYTAKPRTLLEAIKRKRNDSTGQGGDLTDDEANLGNVVVNDWNIDADAETILTGDQFSQHLETGANLEQVEILLDGDNSFIAVSLFLREEILQLHYNYTLRPSLETKLSVSRIVWGK